MENNRQCPLMDNNTISFTECIENCSVVEGFLKPTNLPEIARQKENFREICLACKYHDDD